MRVRGLHRSYENDAGFRRAILVFLFRQLCQEPLNAIELTLNLPESRALDIELPTNIRHLLFNSRENGSAAIVRGPFSAVALAVLRALRAL